MSNFLAKCVCVLFGHREQPGYPENYQPPYCGTCGMENPPNQSLQPTAFGDAAHEKFAKFHWFVVGRLNIFGGGGNMLKLFSNWFPDNWIGFKRLVVFMAVELLLVAIAIYSIARILGAI